MEVDHIYIMGPEGAPGAEAFIALGFLEGLPNQHPGQGTACRRFFFAGAYLELLWVTDAEELRSGPGLLERWTRCGFGILVRGGEPPFATCPYRPAYLPPDMTISVASGVPLHEPAIYHLTGARKSDSDRQLTDVKFGLATREPLSAASLSLVELGLVSFEAAEQDVLHLTFDHGTRCVDLRPRLPLVVYL